MRRLMTRWFAIPVLMFSLLLAGCMNGNEGKNQGSSPNDGKQPMNESEELTPLKEKTKVIIAEDGAASGAGFYIAKEKGYFEDYNIEVEFATFANSDDMLPALAAGKVDIAGGISTASFFNSIAQGIDVKMVADKGHNNKGSSYFTFVIAENMKDKIKTYEDFKGKRIAISSRNSVDDYIFQEMIKHAGLTEKDVDVEIVAEFGNMIAAVGNNSVDAALQIEPLITKGAASGAHIKFKDATDYAPNAQIAMVLASPKFLKDEKEVALRFMAAYLKGVRDYNDAFVKNEGNLDEIIDIMTKHTPLKEKETWKKVNVTGLDPNGKMFKDDIKNQYKMYKKNGAIVGEINVEDAIDTSITEKAVQLLGEYK